MLGKRKGKRAIPFALQTVDGEEVRLEDFNGSWLLMVFHRHLA